jgi:hypothetical protein
MAFEAEAPSDFTGLLSILRREERRGWHRS